MNFNAGVNWVFGRAPRSSREYHFGSTCAHEFGHAFGLPDFYDTDSSSEGDGNWALVRASNTQPTLVLRIEAKSQDKLDSIQEDVSKVLKDAGFTFDPNASGGH